MKGRKGRDGLKGQLVDKSVDAYVLSLETINRLSVKYRVECFVWLVCNAWELLLKARIVDIEKSNEPIYYGRKRGEPKRTLSLRDALSRVYPSSKEPVRRNLERVASLRDEAAHLVISEVPRDVLLLFQACVINYHKKLVEWFGVSISDRVSVGMMTVVYDMSPNEFDVGGAALQRRIGRDAAKYLTGVKADIHREFEELGKSPEYSIGVEYKLVLTKQPGDADIVLNSGDFGRAGAVVQVAKDSSVSHPYRQKELLSVLNDRLSLTTPVNPYDVQCVNKKHSVKSRPEWFYQGKVAGSPPQYSEALLEWLISRQQQDTDFFVAARRSIKNKR